MTRTAKNGDGSPKPSTPKSGSLLLLFVAMVSGGAILLFRPRPVMPTYSPGLPLPATFTLPPYDDTSSSSEAAQNAEALIHQLTRAESDNSTAEDSHTLGEEAKAAVLSLAETEGEDAVDELRNKMARQLTQRVVAKRGAIEKAAAPELGAFPTHLNRYGVTRRGKLVAPARVVLALAKARWNAMAGIPLQSGLNQLEQQYYWGWLAFHADGAETDRRLSALAAYEQAGGPADLELRAILLARLDATAEAATIMEQAHQQTGNLRLRNHALALVQAAATETGSSY